MHTVPPSPPRGHSKQEFSKASLVPCRNRGAACRSPGTTFHVARKVAVAACRCLAFSKHGISRRGRARERKRGSLLSLPGIIGVAHHRRKTDGPSIKILVSYANAFSTSPVSRFPARAKSIGPLSGIRQFLAVFSRCDRSVAVQCRQLSARASSENLQFTRARSFCC